MRAIPGVIADCTGDNAGDSVGPTADGFETYGVVQVALIAFIILGAKSEIVCSAIAGMAVCGTRGHAGGGGGGILHQRDDLQGEVRQCARFNFEAPLTSLVWITSIVTIAVTYPVTYILLPNLGGDPTLWWKLATITSCGTVAGALIPELVKVFTSTEAPARARSGGFGKGGRSCAGPALGICLRELLRLLPGPGDYRFDGDWIRGEHAWDSTA